MYKAMKVVGQYAAKLYDSVNQALDKLSMNYSPGLEGRMLLSGASGQETFTIDHVCLMAGKKRHGKKRGRVHNGLNLPGYDPSKTTLKEYLLAHYDLGQTELRRIMKELGGKNKGRAMNQLRSRRRPGR